MPDALSLSQSELPEEIVEAIEAFRKAEQREARLEPAREPGPWADSVTACRKAKEALTAAILSRLGEADSAAEDAWQDKETAIVAVSRQLRDALARVERLEKAAQATPPDGWVLVPKELTRAMLDAVSKQVDDFSREHTRLFTRDLWADLIASAPQVRPKESSDG